MASNTVAAPSEDISGPSHFVHFYHDDVALVAEVAEFLDRGRRDGGTAIVIATADHISALLQHPADIASLPGEMIMLEAGEALGKFMVDGWPDEQRFDDTIGKVMRKACAEGKTVHAFGEMVALLCAQGLYEAAVRVEQLWNRLREKRQFSLFCAYPWQLFPTEASAAAFHSVCAEHEHVCPQGYGLPDASKDVHLQLARLEQQNRALQAQIAQVRESEQALLQREREFADFVENAAEGLHRVGPDGTILWANKAELTLLGYRWEEFVGHHIAEFHVDPPVIDEILRRLSAGDTLYDQPARLRCKDGSIKHVVIHSNGYFEEGCLRYTRCFTRDATERQLLEQAHRERKSLLEELTQANRAKDEFLAMLAHELRNPLAPISAAAQLLEVAAHEPERVRHVASVITRQVGHMTGLIDDLLDVARVTRGLIVLADEPLDFRRVVSDAVEQVAPQLQARQHRLMLDLPPEAAVVRGDYKRMVQVVVNILANATKFTPDSGEIAIGLGVTEEHVELTVADNGIGMEPDLAARVFGLFTQARRPSDRSQGGLGIGLALVKNLVTAHRGEVHARSGGIGKGSTFTVSLPRTASGPNDRVDAPSLSMPRPAARMLRVMVVDDNRDAADSLAMLLSAAGHQSCAKYTAHSALETVKSDSPHVFLLDVGLPDVDGLTLARRLRSMPEAAGAVLVAVTGYGQERDREQTKDAGFHHHLVKPVDTVHLLALLARIAAQRESAVPVDPPRSS